MLACDNLGMATELPTTKNWLPHFIEVAGTNQNRLAKAMEIDRQQIGKLYKRQDAIPKVWADRIAPHLDVTPVELMYGPGTINAPEVVPSDKPIVEVRVAGQCAAGVWLAEDYVDVNVYDPISVVVVRYPTLVRTAYQIVGPSMDLERIFDGDYVITVPYWEARSKLVDADIVVVERREGHRIERTCKKVVVAEKHVELWPCSSHVSFKTPLIVPLQRNDNEDGIDIEIVGLVINRQGNV